MFHVKQSLNIRTRSLRQNHYSHIIITDPRFISKNRPKNPKNATKPKKLHKITFVFHVKHSAARSIDVTILFFHILHTKTQLYHSSLCHNLFFHILWIVYALFHVKQFLMAKNDYQKRWDDKIHQYHRKKT